MNASPSQLPKPELPESAERLRLALRAANVGLWDWDLRTNEVYFSPEWKRQIGYEAHEITSDFNEWQSRLHPEDLAQTLQSLHAYRTHPAGGYSVEFRFRHKDGSYRWIQADGAVMNDERGQPARLLGSHLDITERKAAETRLKGSEAQYRRLFEAARDGILILNAETGMIEDVNPYLTELLGFTREQFLRKQVWELGFFKHLVANHEKFEELKRVGYVRYEDLPLEAADGRRISVEFVSNVYEVNGAKVIQCNIRNITERKGAQAALQASEERYRALVDRAPTGIFVNVDDQFAYVNDALCRILGASSPEQLLGRPIFDRFLPGLHDVIRQRIAHIRETGEGVPMMDQQHVRLDGSLVAVETMATPTTFQGRPAIQVIVNDVTLRKQAEEALKERAVELERFHRLSVGRELRMVDLKKEVNELAKLAGRTPPYELAFLGGKMGHQTQP